MRRAVVLAVVLVIAPLLASVGTHDAGAADSTHAVPTAIPADWYVIGAQPAPPDGTTSGFRFFSRDLGDRSPALAVGSISCDGGCDVLEGKETSVRGPVGISATLVRNGAYRWVTWLDPSGAQDVVDVVITRNLDDDAAVAAARGVRGDAWALDVKRAALPDGFRDRGLAPVGPSAIPFGAERITFLRAAGGPDVEVFTTRADGVERAAQRFFAGELRRMSHDFERADAVHIDRDRITVASGPGGRQTADRRAPLDDLVISMIPTDEAGWDAFRARVHDIPTSVLLAGLDPGFEVLDGATDTTRWAAAFKDDGEQITAFSVLADVDIGRVVHGSFAPHVPTGTLAGLAGAWDGGASQLLTGVAPAGTASVRFEGTGDPPIAVAPSSAARPSGDHYYAVVLAAAPVSEVVALDADGREIARARV
jgi:hypothetical protein